MGFPKMGVPLDYPFEIILMGIFHYKPSILGYPHGHGHLQTGCGAPSKTPRIQAAQRGLEQRANDAGDAPADTGGVSATAEVAGGVPAVPAANGSARPTGMA